MKAKFSPAVYGALHNAGMSNREIAAHLGVSETAVRRGLKDVPAEQGVRTFIVTVREQ